MVKIYVDERGVVLEFWTNIDLTNYQSIYLVVRKPSGKEETWQCTVSPNYDKNVAMHVVTGDEFDEVGVYKMQLIAEAGGNIAYYSRVVTVYVGERIGVTS